MRPHRHSLPEPRQTRILFIEDSIGVAGSTMSLCALVSALDARVYQAHVIFARTAQQHYWRGCGGPHAETTVIPRRGSVAESRAGRACRRLVAPIHPGAERFLKRVMAALDVFVVTVPYALRLAWYCRRKRIDVIHHNNGFYPYLVLLGWIVRLPIVAYQRGPEWNSPTVRRLVNCLTLYVANSEQTRRDLLSLGVEDRRIVVVYPPVDLSRFHGRLDCTAQREELRLPREVPSFGIVGHLLEWKGQRVFLRAAQRVFGAIPKARAFVIGGAPTSAAAYEQELHALARELRIDDRVVFTGFRTDVPQLMAMLDVVVHASVAPEPFGRVIVEAMAVGRPVIATAAGGPTEIIRSREHGVLVPSGDEAALAREVVSLLREREVAAAMGRCAAAEVHARFSLPAHVTRMQEIYAHVLGPAGARCEVALQSRAGET